jgi:cytochrome P450
MPEAPPELPTGREDPLHPARLLAEFRRQAPATEVRLWDGRPVWLITRYDAARAVLRDRRFSADGTNPGFPRLTPSILASTERGDSRNFSRMDDPVHSALRRLVAQPFSTRSIEVRRTQTQDIAGELLDEMAKSGSAADLVTAYALPIPAKMISTLLGVPYREQEFFRERVTTAVIAKGVPTEESRRARAELLDYLDGIVGRRITGRSDDLISHLLTHFDSGTLSRRDIVTMAWLMLVAGYETTSCMISLVAFTLLAQPDLARQVTECEELPSAARDELLRFHTVVNEGIPRVALEDVQLGDGCRIRRGDGVIVSVAAANRDPAVFANPDEIDIRRKNVREHLAFGAGAHQCLGHTLATLEVKVAIPALFARFPGLRLAVAPDAVRFRGQATFHGLAELPVRW